jgi:hypothetical protein
LVLRLRGGWKMIWIILFITPFFHLLFFKWFWYE